MHTTFTLIVRDQPGVLVRIAHIFARRSCNIRSLHVAPRDDQWSTMIIAATDVANPEQMRHQLEKLVDVQRVSISK